MIRQKGTKWGEFIVKTLITGGIWTAFKLASMAPSRFSAAWTERATFQLSSDPSKSPWRWLGKAWLATFLGLFTLELSALCYFTVMSFFFRGTQLVGQHGMPNLTALALTIPVLIAHVAYLGHIVILITHTLWPARLVASVSARIVSLREALPFSSRRVAKTS